MSACVDIQCPILTLSLGRLTSAQISDLCVKSGVSCVVLICRGRIKVKHCELESFDIATLSLRVCQSSRFRPRVGVQVQQPLQIGVLAGRRSPSSSRHDSRRTRRWLCQPTIPADTQCACQEWIDRAEDVYGSRLSFLRPRIAPLVSRDAHFYSGRRRHGPPA